MKQIETAVANWLIFITCPLWLGFFCWYIFVDDFLNNEYSRATILKKIKGQERFFE